MTLSNAQADAAEEIRLIVSASDEAAKTAVAKAIEAGHRLIAAKSDCPHGTWLPFLERAGVPERKAQRFMALARSGLKSDTVTDLGGIKAALHFVSQMKLPKLGSGLTIFADESRSFFHAAHIWASSKHPGYFYIVAYNGEDIAATPRPISGETIEFPGEANLNPVWVWIERYFEAPSQLWEFEPANDAVIASMFTPLDLEGWSADEANERNLANVAGIQDLIEQCRDIREKEAA